VEYFDRIHAAACGDLEPERFELRLGFLLAQLAPGDAVLDVGCGSGWFSGAVARAGFSVVGVDVSPVAIARARRRCPGIEFAVSGEDSLPFPDGAFSVAWCGETLEHVRDGLGLLAEIARVVGPGGRLLVSTPDHGARRRLWLGVNRRAFEANFEPRADHLRFFTRRTLTATLEAAGFDGVGVRAARGVLLATARAAR